MTILDLCIVLLVLVTTFIVYRKKHTLLYLKLWIPFRLIVYGLLATGCYFTIDLFTMYALPFFVGEEASMQVMAFQHLNAAWVVVIAVVSITCGSLLYASAKIAPQIARSEKESRSSQEAAEQKLRESEGRFRNLVEGSLQGILITREEKPIFVNEALVNLLGYGSQEEILKLNSISQLKPEYEKERLDHYRAAHLRGDEVPTQYEVDFLRNDGSIVTVENAVRVVNWMGESAIQNTLIDVTEHKRVERELRLHGEIVRNLAEGVHLVRVEDETIVFANPTFEGMFGYEQGEILGQPMSNLNAPTDKSPTETAREVSRA